MTRGHPVEERRAEGLAGGVLSWEKCTPPKPPHFLRAGGLGAKASALMSGTRMAAYEPDKRSGERPTALAGYRGVGRA